MFEKVIDGTLYIPTRAEVVGKTKIAIVNDINSGSEEQMYASWADLYDGLYKQDDPFNKKYRSVDGQHVLLQEDRKICCHPCCYQPLR